MADAQGATIAWTWTFHPQPTAVGRLLTRAATAPLHRPYLQRILVADLARAEAAAPVVSLTATD